MKASKFVVPKSDQREFDRVVQRANRRIQANLRYIQEEGIESSNAKRALLGDYVDSSTWAGAKSAFSRSKTFESKKAYQQFMRHVNQWGAEGTYERSAGELKQGYVKAIVKAITTTALDNGGGGILTEDGKLPADIVKDIESMTLEQLTHFFDEADPTEDIERAGFDSLHYIGVDRDTFVDITKSKLSHLKQVYPDKSKPKKTKAKKAKRQRKKK